MGEEIFASKKEKKGKKKASHRWTQLERSSKEVFVRLQNERISRF